MQKSENSCAEVNRGPCFSMHRSLKAHNGLRRCTAATHTSNTTAVTTIYRMMRVLPIAPIQWDIDRYCWDKV